jgi:DNA-binding MarR family transcriptional regulator
VTRTIDTVSQPGAAVRPDPTGAIIADFRATMGQLKCASSERLLRLGVSMAQLHIMFTLQRSGEMTMTQLADVLNVSLSNATGLIDRLEERGYITRERVATDRRVVLVRVTPAGDQMLEEVDALSEALLRSVLERIPVSQLKVVGHAISALRDAVDSTVGSMADRHLASTMTPRSGSTMRSADPTRHPHERD